KSIRLTSVSVCPIVVNGILKRNASSSTFIIFCVEIIGDPLNIYPLARCAAGHLYTLRSPTVTTFVPVVPCCAGFTTGICYHTKPLSAVDRVLQFFEVVSAYVFHARKHSFRLDHIITPTFRYKQLPIHPN